MSKSRRWSKRFDFDLFYRDAKRTFDEIATRDARHELLKHTYSFLVVPGGSSLGASDKRVVEVFYGQRPFEAVEEPADIIKGPYRRGLRLLREGGAMLRYERGDNGVVLCLLYPAHSEHYRRREDAILLAYIQNPNVLTGPWVPERHWRAFMAYMQWTSLDGEPSAADRLRVWWLLFSRRLIVKGRDQTPKIWTIGAQIVQFSATVGLSGFLLALVQLWLSKHQSEGGSSILPPHPIVRLWPTL